MELDRLVDALRAPQNGAGVREWSIYFSRSRRLSLGIKDREVGNAHAPLRMAESCGAHYRLIWNDGRVSRGYLERRQLEGDPAQALQHALAAAYEDPDAACISGPAEIPDVELHDARTAEIAGGATDLLARRLEAIRRRVAEHGFRTWSGSFSAGDGTARIVTSSGLDVAGRGTTTGWGVTINGEVSDGHSARRPESEEEYDARLDRLMERADQLQRPAKPMDGGTLPVIFHPSVVEEYVVDTLLDNLGGSTVANGEGHFRREQFGSGDPVLREDLGLRLDPLRPFRSGSYRFTGEGVPAARCAYIERGRLVQPVLDLKYARRLGLDPTPLPAAADTLFFEGSTPLALTDALVEAGGGALVLSVLGVHTQDGASGDFSLSAPQALRIEAGDFAGRLRATVSGNLFSILNDDALRFVTFEGEHTPGLLFPCRLDPR